MLKKRNIIQSILQDIERLDDTVFCYATVVSNQSNTKQWWQISVSQYEFYSDERFRALAKKWHKITDKINLPLVFVCGWKPSEKTLVELMENNNLILAIKS